MADGILSRLLGKKRTPEEQEMIRGLLADAGVWSGPDITPAQAAYLVSQFAPGAATLDASGGMPTAPTSEQSLLDYSSRNPSMAENFRQGNYGTAALQGLGILGDMTYAGTPLLGATLGSAMKAPRVIQKAMRGGTPPTVPSTTSRFTGERPTVTRDTGLLQRVGDVDRVNAMQVEMSRPAFSEVPIIGAEDIINRPYVSGMSDTTRSAREVIEAINGTEIGAPMYGGKYYGFQNPNRIWASDTGAVTTLLNKADLAKDLEGAKGDVLFVPYGMSASSPDFATMLTDVMIPYSSANMTKKAKAALDKRIREGTTGKADHFRGVPNWPGIDSPDVMQFLRDLGGKRKNVSQALDEFRGDGALTLSEARAAITDPAQFNPSFGLIDTAYIIDPNKVSKPGTHPTYNTDIFGSPLGAFQPGYSVLDLNPRYGMNSAPYVQSRPNLAAGNKPSSPDQKAAMGGLFGVFTQDIVDDMVRRGIVRP